MTEVHLHLLVTHLPVFGSFIGALVLSYGLWAKSQQTKNAAYLLFMLSAIGAAIAYLTGEGAEEAVEKIAGVSEQLIEQHEDAAVYSLLSLVVLGAFSGIALLANRAKSSWANPASSVILFLSMLSFGLVAWTGYLGGQIRHTEIASTAMIMTTGGDNDSDDD